MNGINAERRIVLASGNAGKLREFSTLLAPLGLELVPQAALGVPPVDEPFATFLENALAKARHASRMTGLPALADDSGICVNALGGRPGVWSARWACLGGAVPVGGEPGGRRSDTARYDGVESAGAPPHAMPPGAARPDVGQSDAAVQSDAANSARLVADLARSAGRAGRLDRSAHYYCVLVLVRAADDPRPVVADASWQGEVIDAARGSAGFGYDPHFMIPSLARTVAELDDATKNRLSHRGRAMRALIERLRDDQTFAASTSGAR